MCIEEQDLCQQADEGSALLCSSGFTSVVGQGPVLVFIFVRWNCSWCDRACQL